MPDIQTPHAYRISHEICTHWKLKVVNLTTLSSLVAPQVVKMTTYDATSEDKVVKLIIFCFQYSVLWFFLFIFVIHNHSWWIHVIYWFLLFRVSSLAHGQWYDCPIGQWYDCPIVRDVTLNDEGKIIKPYQIICIIIGMYCNWYFSYSDWHMSLTFYMLHISKETYKSIYNL